MVQQSLHWTVVMATSIVAMAPAIRVWTFIMAVVNQPWLEVAMNPAIFVTATSICLLECCYDMLPVLDMAAKLTFPISQR